MFETLVTPSSQTRRLDPRVLPATVTLHAVALLGITVVGLWKVEDLPVPNAAFDQPFVEILLPPPPPPPPRGVERQQLTRTEPTATPQTVQPEIVPPTPPETPSNSGTTVPLDDLTPASGNEGQGSSDGVDGSTGPADGGGDCLEGCGEAPAPADNEPIIIVPGVERPVAIHRPSPLYPEAARRVGRQGTVIVEAVIDTNGRVRDVRLLSKKLGLGLDESALSAVREWRFEPATRKGVPVAVYFQLTVTFSLNR